MFLVRAEVNQYGFWLWNCKEIESEGRSLILFWLMNRVGRVLGFQAIGGTYFYRWMDLYKHMEYFS